MRASLEGIMAMHSLAGEIEQLQCKRKAEPEEAGSIWLSIRGWAGSVLQRHFWGSEADCSLVHGAVGTWGEEEWH